MQIKFVTILGLLFLLASNPSLRAEEAHSEHHDHDEKSAHVLKLDHGKKWKSDDSLRKGMSAIQTLMKKNLPDARHGIMKDVGYQTLSDAIDVQVALIFKNCKLDPQADQMLHLVLIQIIEGSSAMKADQPTLARKTGALKVVQALKVYGQFFAHPGWVAI